MTEIQTQQIKQVYKSYCLDFSELDLDAAIVEDYIGFVPGSAPDPFPNIIAEILSESAKRITPQGGFEIFDNLGINRMNKSLTIRDVNFNADAIVTRHMNKARSVAVFACTAGPEISRLASEYNRKGHAVHAYIADSLGSIIVERSMDIIQEHLRVLMSEKGLKITNRYSPGYCGWDVKEQKELFGLLPDNYCGITLTDSMLMKPIKSVSGIIGIGKDVTYDHYSCNYCKDINCLYRGKR